TLLGKLLAFVNLIVGLAILTWSVSLYAQRPVYFEKVEAAPGQNVETFAQLKEDIDALGRAASAASAQWGGQLKRVQDLEKLRADRRKGLDERLAWTRTGNPNDKDNPGAGFYEPVYE